MKIVIRCRLCHADTPTGDDVAAAAVQPGSRLRVFGTCRACNAELTVAISSKMLTRFFKTQEPLPSET